VLCETYRVDATHDLVKVRELIIAGRDGKVSVELKAPSLCLMKFRKAGPVPK
jgi:hypothetical protein